MHHFTYERLDELPMDLGLWADLNALHAAKEQLAAAQLQQPQTLDRLTAIAKTKSIVASNAMESIFTADNRVEPLLTERVMPRNADEAQMVGYRDACQIIDNHYSFLTVTPNSILQLHQVLYSRTGLGVGGEYKTISNYVPTIDAQGETVWFKPTSPDAVPAAVATLCAAFEQALTANSVDPLICIGVFVRDFLCIHPFFDGNGRVSRLLTDLLFYRAGYFGGRYVSLSEKIDQTKTDYYTALRQSQTGWHEDVDNPIPFVKYLVHTLRVAYDDLAERLVVPVNRKTSLAIVQTAITKVKEPFTKGDLREFCPNLDDVTIAHHLTTLAKRGVIARQGTTKATCYTRC